MIVPLNIIQYDQMAALQNRGISACKLDVEGRGSQLRFHESEDEDDDDTEDLLTVCI